jgi:hypothetical protein
VPGYFPRSLLDNCEWTQGWCTPFGPLTSPLADYIHGSNLRVDGGYVTAIN